MLDYGLVLKKVHKVLQFDQSPWLANYIEHNTNLRKLANNKFDKVTFYLDFSRRLISVLGSSKVEEQLSVWQDL